MSNLFEDTPIKELPWLLKQIQQREMALPDLQRNFVWEPSATQELICSIVNSYPAGSLLSIRNTGEFFQARNFEGAPDLINTTPTYLILDGQQRLTSLFQALYGVGEYRYFIKLRELIDGNDIDDAIFHVRTSATRGWHAITRKKFDDFKNQVSDLVLPLSVILGTPDGFIGWADEIVDSYPEASRKELKSKLNDIRKKFINPIESYKFPVVLLSDKTPPDAVCTIFETLNRTGVRLSVFDLLTARYWPKNVKLREMWELAKTNHPVLEDFAIDPYYVLQIVSLLSAKDSPSCKRKDVLLLKAPTVSELWDNAITGLSRALMILREDCGVMLPKWLPYNTIVVPFAAILARNDSHAGLLAGNIRKKTVKWFWNSVLGQSYENAPNSQASKDLIEVSAWIHGGDEPSTIRDFRFDRELLFSITPKQRAVYSGIISLILSGHPRDFHNLQQITMALMNAEGIDDHHIFPDAYLREQGVTSSRERDCIVNRTLIDRATNQSLSRRDPSSYFSEIRESLGPDQFASLLESHMLPAEDESPLLRDAYKDFLQWRADRIFERITKATRGAI